MKKEDRGTYFCVADNGEECDDGDDDDDDDGDGGDADNMFMTNYMMII